MHAAPTLPDVLAAWDATTHDLVADGIREHVGPGLRRYLASVLAGARADRGHKSAAERRALRVTHAWLHAPQVHAHDPADQGAHVLAALFAGMPAMVFDAANAASVDRGNGLATIVRAHGCAPRCVTRLRYRDGSLVVLLCGDAAGEA